MTAAGKASGRRFFQYAAILMAAVVFVGFSRTFFFKPYFPEVHEFVPPESFFRVHGAIFSAWILWLVLQASLVPSGRVALHRKLGWIGAAIAFLVVCTGIYGAALAAGRPGGFLGVDFPSAQFFIIPFTAMVFFGTFVALAIAWRSKPQHHKRAMLLATVNLLEAAFIRFPFAFIPAYAPLSSFGPALLFIVALGVHDKRTTGRIHPVTLWGGISIALSLPVAFALSGTGPWLAFSTWIIALLG